MKSDPEPLANRRSATSTTRIRRLALAGMVLLIPVGTLLGVGHGQRWGPAGVAALLASGQGLATWAAYHLISGRNNGIILVASGFSRLSKAADHSWGETVFLLIVGLVVGSGIGLASRIYDDWQAGRAGTKEQDRLG